MLKRTHHEATKDEETSELHGHIANASFCFVCCFWMVAGNSSLLYLA